jgi:predicted nucleotidyltransferase component of viral defense system
MSLEMLSNFNLVGGTALALQFGHRISVDLDLFSTEEFDDEALINSLTRKFGKEAITININQRNTLLIKIKDIKVDFLYYPYGLVKPAIEEDSIRMLSIEDIAPMKLSALSKRGAKKDFFDIYELISEKFTLKEIFGFYKQKFENHELSFLARSLLYFDDAENDLDPIMIKDYSWSDVKNEISKQVDILISN